MVVLSCALAGCGYQPGSFRFGPGPEGEAEFVGQRVTVGCLDIAVARRIDFESKAVLQYRFGNRCDGPVQIDLRRAAVVGRFADGREVALAPYDPRLEMLPLRLDGRLGGGEAIAYPTPRPVTQICIDAGSIMVRAQPAQWLCFATQSDLDLDTDESPEPSEPVAHESPDAQGEVAP